MTAACLANDVTSLRSRLDLSPAIVRKGGRAQRIAGGFSRPPFCRIAPHVEGCVLELEPGMERIWLDGQACRRKTFASLAAAIDYAVTRGWRYRVLHAAPPPRVPSTRHDRHRLRDDREGGPSGTGLTSQLYECCEAVR
jgi:hypothetical protein